MAPPKLYMVDLCPTVRTVLLTARALGLTLDYRVLNFINLDQFTAADYLKPSLQYTVPTLVDNGYVLWHSHSIIAYLIGKYANDDSLYPKEQEKRNLIDERLHFDSEILFSNLLCIIRNMVACGDNNVSEIEERRLFEIYDYLEDVLGNQLWMAGDKLTIADLSLIPSVTSADILVPIDQAKYPKLYNWIKRSQTLPYYEEANQTGLDNFKNLIKTIHV